MSKENLYHIAPIKEPERQLFFMEQCKRLLKEKTSYTFRIETFGCQMNFRDSEKIAGILKEIGYQEATSTTLADFVIYNTCTVRENANRKVYGHLGLLKKEKEKNPSMIVALCGCMMQEPAVVEKIKKSYRFVDIIFGTHNIFELAELIFTCLENRKEEQEIAKTKPKQKTRQKMIVDIWEDTDKIVEELPEERKYPFKASVNIMYGCNNFCSYCIVPYVRGRERSRKPEHILSEIKRLVADGVVEIMLLGQNVNSYGKNLSTPITFAFLLRQIEQIEGLKRIRFMTSHPKDLSDDLIAAMAESTKICNHLHLPVQSGSSKILKKMNRNYTKEQYLTLVEKIKTAIPNISLSTDIIVGFPGETEDDFLETIDLVRKVQFDSAYTFQYSKRSHTPAANMENQVPADVVQERFERLISEIAKSSSEKIKQAEGKIEEVLVEEKNNQKTDWLTGRLSNNILVHFKGEESMIGKLIPVKLQECKGFYYIGEIQ